MATTARLGFPMLAAGQAQKEILHNEALVLADMLVQPMAQSIGENDPPDEPGPGQMWIVGAAPTGSWMGQSGAIAGWSDGGWRFVPPFAGAHLYLAANRQWVRYEDGHWDPVEIDGSALKVNGVQVVGAREDPISGPSGGITVDSEARTAIDAILVALRSHGLIST